MMGGQFPGGPGNEAGADDARQRDTAYRQQQPPPASRENSGGIMTRIREIPHGPPGVCAAHYGKFGD